MSIIEDNLFLMGASGMVGKQMVFRNCKGKTILAKPPRRTKQQSNAQQEHNSRFKGAVAYAKAAIADKEIRKGYNEKAAQSVRCLSAFNVAISDYMHSPVIRDIDLSYYRGQLCDVIKISATDDFQVASVMIEILRDDGSLLEVGMAEYAISNPDEWVYYAQSSVASVSGYRVNVIVTDLPGNVTEKRVDL